MKQNDTNLLLRERIGFYHWCTRKTKTKQNARPLDKLQNDVQQSKNLMNSTPESAEKLVHPKHKLFLHKQVHKVSLTAIQRN